MFRITGNTGFHITFANGMTVSVQFGGGNYCANYSAEIGVIPSFKDWECPDAEVAVWDRDRNWVTKEFYHTDDIVMEGYKTAEDVLALLNWAAKYESKEEK